MSLSIEFPKFSDPFVRWANQTDSEISLAEGALLIARESYPSLRAQRYFLQLDEIAEEAHDYLNWIRSDYQRVEQLIWFLFEHHGFRGNEDDYYDPRNSYLNEVLERRLGIPITLAIIYIEVAQRLKWDIQGVGFPGHFLLRYQGEQEILIDPFYGRILDEEECEELWSQVSSADMPMDPRFLETSNPRSILARMLRNLKGIYMKRRDWAEALTCCNRILYLEPEAILERRDRGLVYAELECFHEAREDLENFFDLVPSDWQDDGLMSTLAAVRQSEAKVN